MKKYTIQAIVEKTITYTSENELEQLKQEFQDDSIGMHLTALRVV